MPLPISESITAGTPGTLITSIRLTILPHLHKQRNHHLFILLSLSSPERLSPVPVPSRHNHFIAFSLVPNTYLPLSSLIPVPTLVPNNCPLPLYFIPVPSVSSLPLSHIPMSVQSTHNHFISLSLILVSNICPHLFSTPVPNNCPRPLSRATSSISKIHSISDIYSILLSQLPVYLPSPISQSLLLFHPFRSLPQTLTGRLHTHHFVV
jgi:hypothetical protein